MANLRSPGFARPISPGSRRETNNGTGESAIALARRLPALLPDPADLSKRLPRAIHLARTRGRRRAAGYDDMGNPIGRDTSFGMRDQLLSAKKARGGVGRRQLVLGQGQGGVQDLLPAQRGGDRASGGEETPAHDPRRRPMRHERRRHEGHEARIVEVVDFVEVDEDLGVEVSMTQDPELQGTMYAVSIPVRQVKPEFDVENETYGWDEEPIYDDDAWEAAKRE